MGRRKKGSIKMVGRRVPPWFRKVVRKMTITGSIGTNDITIRVDVVVDGKEVGISVNYNPRWGTDSATVNKGIIRLANRATRALWEKVVITHDLVAPCNVLTPILPSPINDVTVWT